jgi:DNA-binding transcriptional LysR family regulator
MSTPVSALSLQQLLCFVAVVDTGSFAEAGRQLGLSTSGVSKALTRFEAVHGLKLFHRSTHALSLTEEGENLLGLAREAVGSMGRLEESLHVSAARSGAGRVRISAPTAFVRSCLVPLVPRLLAEQPGIFLDLRASDRMIDLAEEGVDLVLRTGAIDGVHGHAQQVLFRFSWVTCASPDYLLRRGTPSTPADLAGHDLVGFRNQRTGTVDPWRFRENEVGQSATPGGRWMPDVRIALDDADAAFAAVIAGVGIAWAPEWLARPYLRSRAVVEVLGDWRHAGVPMSILRRDRRHTPERIERVIAFLRVSAAEMSS